MSTPTTVWVWDHWETHGQWCPGSPSAPYWAFCALGDDFMPVRKPEKPEKPAVVADGRDKGVWPELLAHLCDTTYLDGSKRQTCTLFVFVDDGVFKAALNDRDEDLTLWANGTSLTDLLNELEGLLGCDVPPWKAKSQKGGRKGR